MQLYTKRCTRDRLCYVINMYIGIYRCRWEKASRPRDVAKILLVTSEKFTSSFIIYELVRDCEK